LQNEKQEEHRNSTLDGIIIDRTDEELNANDTIRFNDENCSNAIDSRYWQHKKQ
jgi:hypothetical protein